MNSGVRQFLMDAFWIGLLVFFIKALNQGVNDQTIIQAVGLGLIAATFFTAIRQLRSGDKS